MSNLVHRVRFVSDHRWAAPRMSAYVDGELMPSGRLRLERHVGECKECRRLLAALREMLDALHRLPAPVNPDPNRLATTVRGRLHEPPRSA
jgi:anti-sigma factor RsiW